MYNIKHTLGSKISLAVALATLVALPVGAGGLIDSQQQQLKETAPVWTTPKIPAGMMPVVGTPTVRTSATTGVSLLARKVDFIVTDDIGFNIENLAASFEPVRAGEPVNFDDPTQFIIRVHAGEVVIPPSSLVALFNKHLLDYSPRPLDDMKISTGKDSLVAKGGLKLWNWFPGIWLPAHLDGNITLNENGLLVYSPTDVRALGIPLGGLLRLLGIKLTWLLQIDREGAQLVNNDLVLDHTKVFPPPALAGKVREVSLDEAGLRLKFNDNPAAKFTPPAHAPESFLWIQSGDVKLFNLVVTNANILVKDEDASGNLRFDLYGYRQLIAAKNVLTMAEDGALTATLSTIKK